jgi:proline iminopeptidase
VLRGVFTARKREIDWLYKHGASALFPEAFAKFAEFIPPNERDDLVTAYFLRLTSGEREQQIEAARSWCAWEGSLMTLTPRSAYSPGHGDQTLALARIETHYFVNESFLIEGEILANVGKLAGLPGIIVQGRYDVVTPPTTAFELHLKWPGSKLEIVPDAGHATSEPGTMRKLVEATDFFRST